MAEHVCIDYRKDFNLPISIFRPSIVSASEAEPIQGWCDNLNGPLGLIFAGAFAINHVAYGTQKDNKMDVIPVDVCVKGMIVSAWTTWKDHQPDTIKSDICILNATSVRVGSYGSLIISGTSLVRSHPSIKLFGIPSTTFTQCAVYAWILRIFRNIIPSLIVDSLLRIAGKKPQ